MLGDNNLGCDKCQKTGEFCYYTKDGNVHCGQLDKTLCNNRISHYGCVATYDKKTNTFSNKDVSNTICEGLADNQTVYSAVDKKPLCGDLNSVNLPHIRILPPYGDGNPVAMGSVVHFYKNASEIDAMLTVRVDFDTMGRNSSNAQNMSIRHGFASVNLAANQPVELIWNATSLRYNPVTVSYSYNNLTADTNLSHPVILSFTKEYWNVVAEVVRIFVFVHFVRVKLNPNPSILGSCFDTNSPVSAAGLACSIQQEKDIKNVQVIN